MKWKLKKAVAHDADLYGLALVMVLAGLSKLLFPELWSGYTPGWVQGLLPLSREAFNLSTAGIEIFLGSLLALGWRRKEVSIAVSAWIFGITVSVASMQLWTIALRDFGLLILSLSVVLEQLGSESQVLQ